MTNLRQYLSSKVVLLAGLMSAVYCALDFSERFVASGKMSETRQGEDSIVTLASPLVSPTHAQLISELYAKYSAEETNTAPVTQIGMSEEEQLAQSGERQKVFVGDIQLSLKAVVYHESAQAKQALVQRVNIKSNETSIEPVSDGSMVESFTLKVVDLTSVELTRKTEKGNQNILLTLYKSNRKQS